MFSKFRKISFSQRALTSIFLILLVMISQNNCGKGRHGVKMEDLIKKGDGKQYEMGSDKPFSGIVIKSISDSSYARIPFKDGMVTSGIVQMYRNNYLTSEFEINQYFKYTGYSKYFYKSGVLESEMFFDDEGVANGTYRHWFKNGQLNYLINMNHGKIDGPYKGWHANGNKKVEIDNVKCQIENPKDSKMMLSLIPMVVDIPDTNFETPGDFKDYLNEQMSTQRAFGLGIEINGTYQYWYENGKLAGEAHLVNGYTTEDVKCWDENGNPIN